MSIPFVFANQSGIIPLNELDANFNYLDNKVPPLALAAGVVTQASQPAITAVGTLGSLSVTGPVSAASVSAVQIFGTLATAAQPNINEIGALTTLTVSNTITTGSVTATSLTGQLNTAAQPAITSVGTLSALTVAGGITGTLVTAAQPAVTSVGTLTTLTVSGGISGTLTTAAQPNITSVGTLTNLAVAGNISGTLSTAAQPAITSVGTLTALSVSGAISGTLSTAAQPNVTSVGTLSTLAVSGNLSVGGVTSLTGVVTAPTAGNGTSNTQVATTSFVQNSLTAVIPSGIIVMWSGVIANVPAGWLLCDGTNGTPDLRNRFVVGAGSTYAPGNIGGSANATVVSHTHTASSVVADPGHRHSYTAPSGFATGGSFGSSVVDTTVSANTGNATTGITVNTTVNSAGSSGVNANLPPYYALAYIMKA